MKRKCKKSLILLALIYSSMSVSINAATIDKIKLNAGKIEVSGTSSAKDITYKIYSSTLSDDEKKQISKIAEIGEAPVSSDGKFSFTLTMPKIMGGIETDGQHYIEIKDSSKTTKSFLFTSYSHRQAFIDSVNAVDVSSATAVADMLSIFDGTTNVNSIVYDNTDIMNNLGADGDYYKILTSTDEKSKIASGFLAERGTTLVTQGNFPDIYSHAQASYKAQNTTIDSNWFKETDLSFEGVKAEDAEDSVKSWVLSIIKDGTVYGSYKDIETKYIEANILYILDNAKMTDYDTLISAYNNYNSHDIELKPDNYSTYEKMEKLNKLNVNTALRNAVAASAPKTKEDFQAAYKKAIANEVAAMNSGNGGNGGSGGGKSSSGGGLSIIVPEVTNPITVVSSFSDIESVKDWAETAITALAKQGIISGYDDNSFKPQQSIKREEFVKMVIAAANIDLNKPACKFDDVEQDKWYAQYVNAAYGAGIISGTSETDFGIGKGITREDMAVIIARLIDLDDVDSEAVFADDAYISGYAKESVYKLYRAGKIAGIGNNQFAPKEIVTRAQAAKIIYDTLVSGN